MSALPDAATADAPDRRALAQAGVADARRVQSLLASPEFEGADVAPLVERLGHAADPDRAALAAVRIAEAEVEIDLAAAVVQVRRHGVPHRAGLQHRQAQQ